jgi:hypothetical protein
LDIFPHLHPPPLVKEGRVKGKEVYVYRFGFEKGIESHY